MVDFPEKAGKMCDWDKVQTVDGALQVLSELSLDHSIYVATNADDSTEKDIKAAFERVGLSQYIDGYFCKSNLGVGKSSPDFYFKISEKLQVSPESLVMVGDSLEKDVKPALTAGLDAFWFNPTSIEIEPNQVKQINSLVQLCIERSN
ncbi:HAD family hydrolase [Vibrio sp. HN007]|uniref:HAD family hydrolase n=1 Tax=Vibrio iocasae TaxID=3098914 RepID=UPI0035D4ECDB